MVAQEILFSEEGFRLKRKPEAEKKAGDARFASSKAISSDDYFGRKEEQDPEVTARLERILSLFATFWLSLSGFVGSLD